MITIEHLEVLFETVRENDEAYFEELFARHISRHDSVRREQKATRSHGDADRSLDYEVSG